MVSIHQSVSDNLTGKLLSTPVKQVLVVNLLLTMFYKKALPLTAVHSIVFLLLHFVFMIFAENRRGTYKALFRLASATFVLLVFSRPVETLD